jgi:hypothetical protein
MAGISVEFVGQFLFKAHVETSWVMSLKLPTEIHAYSVALQEGSWFLCHLTASWPNSHYTSKRILMLQLSYLPVATRIVRREFTSLASWQFS